jgi:predicted nucleic acid-binding protein
VAEVWVTNASPVIVLAKAGHLRLLRELPDELLLPDAVVAEVLAGPPADPARQALEAGWAAPQPAGIPTELLEWGLGRGETAVLALAQQRAPATVILDDAAARTCARALGLSLLGTLGIVLRAKRRGLISSAADVLRDVRAAGLHLDDGTIRQALEAIGEPW